MANGAGAKASGTPVARGGQAPGPKTMLGAVFVSGVPGTPQCPSVRQVKPRCLDAALERVAGSALQAAQAHQAALRLRYFQLRWLACFSSGDDVLVDLLTELDSLLNTAGGIGNVAEPKQSFSALATKCGSVSDAQQHYAILRFVVECVLTVCLLPLMLSLWSAYGCGARCAPVACASAFFQPLPTVIAHLHSELEGCSRIVPSCDIT